MSDHTFDATVESLFKGMDSFITTKTVVGEAVHIGDTIILPLVDVSFGVAAGVFAKKKQSNGGGGMGGKIMRCTCDFKRHDETCECKKSGWNYKSFRYGT